MNSSSKPSPLSTSDKSSPAESPGELKPEDFPSGDEEDREGGNAGPDEKRHPDGGAPPENSSLSEVEKNDAGDWTKRTPAGTPVKPGIENPATYK